MMFVDCVLFYLVLLYVLIYIYYDDYNLCDNKHCYNNSLTISLPK